VEPITAVPLFVVSVVVTLSAARLFARRLDLLGSRFGFPEAMIGLLTALAADGPEISSALFALAKGQHSVGVGVLVGSNAFNLAAMIGLSGLIAGCIRLPRATLMLEGLAGGLVTAIAVAVLLGWLAPAAAVILAACVLVPYLVLVIGQPRRLAGWAPVGRLVRDDLGERASRPNPGTASGMPASGAPASGPPASGPPASGMPASGVPASEGLAFGVPVSEALVSETSASGSSGSPTHHLLGLVVLDVALIVAGSAGMVQAALSLGASWHVSTAVLGVLILAPLTSLPNAMTAVRLGLAGRGAALVGETFNSNTINLAAGVLIPSLFVTLAASTGTAKLQLGWLVGMTFVCLLLLVPDRGMRRPGAAAMVVLYLGFVGLQL
jgi:cation:H+ antiporter